MKKVQLAALFAAFSFLLHCKEVIYIPQLSEPVKGRIIHTRTQAGSKTPKETIRGYNAWQDEIADMEVKEAERNARVLRAQGTQQDAELAIKYKDAIYRDFVERKALERDLIRAQIYWYYYCGYRRYYYYDVSWNVVFIN